MSREIELKVALSNQQYSEIKEIISGKSEFPDLKFHSLSHILKSDEYFSKYRTREERLKNNELRVIRIRSEKTIPLKPSGVDIFGDESEGGEKSYFCIKRKSVENGLEYNSESETFIENPAVLRSFFEASGFIKWFSKTKDSYSVFTSFSSGEFRDYEAHLELEKVNGLPYIEIEYTKENLPAEKVRLMLEKILESLGIDPEKRDGRSWIEIVGDGKSGE